jgi:ribosomal protein S18 acetylase RimI-like enzyme
MHVRPVTAVGLDLFVESGGDPAYHREVRRYLDAMFAAGSMRPEWCFVAEKNGTPVGRIAFWTLPGMEEPFAIVLFDAGWTGNHHEVGARLLGYALDEAYRLGSWEIEHVIDAPPQTPQFQVHAGRRVELLEGAGFSMRRETGRFEWRGGGLSAATDRLRFRALDEAGEEAFVNAIMRVSRGTLDQEIQAGRDRLGPEGAARDFFEDAARVEHEPSWWRLAYDGPEGDLVGLVMPAYPPGFLTIFYVGVVPEMRGRGYVDHLLSAGTATLLDARVSNDTPLRADTDVSNAPMSAAFGRAGWARFARRREYVAILDSKSGRE